MLSVTLPQLDSSEDYCGSVSWGEVYGGHMACFLADYELLTFLCITQS